MSPEQTHPPTPPGGNGTACCLRGRRCALLLQERQARGRRSEGRWAAGVCARPNAHSVSRRAAHLSRTVTCARINAYPQGSSRPRFQEPHSLTVHGQTPAETEAPHTSGEEEGSRQTGPETGAKAAGPSWLYDCNSTHKAKAAF